MPYSHGSMKGAKDGYPNPSSGVGYDDMGKGIKYSGHGSDGYSKPQDVAGVGSGLNMRENVDVKDLEKTTSNQRPMGRKESVGEYILGTC